MDGWDDGMRGGVGVGGISHLLLTAALLKLSWQPCGEGSKARLECVCLYVVIAIFGGFSDVHVGLRREGVGGWGESSTHVSFPPCRISRASGALP